MEKNKEQARITLTVAISDRGMPLPYTTIAYYPLTILKKFIARYALPGKPCPHAHCYTKHGAIGI